MGTAPRILLVRFSSLGDLVLTTPVLRALRARYPDAMVSYATKRAFAPLLAGDPDVAEVFALRPDEPLSRYAGRIAETSYDFGIDLHRSLRSLYLRRRVSTRWSAYPKARVARWRSIWLGPVPQPHVTERYHRALEPLGITGDPGPPRLHPGPAARAEADQVPGDRLVALAPGASTPTKRWGPARWRDLARGLRAAGYTPVGVGHAADEALLPGPDAEPAYHLSLEGTVALLARCVAVVANDSGLLHAAGAVETPAVALFGPTHPALGFAPVGSPNRIVQLDLACRPCSTFGGRDCPRGRRRCLDDLDAATVLDAVTSLP